MYTNKNTVMYSGVWRVVSFEMEKYGQEVGGLTVRSEE